MGHKALQHMQLRKSAVDFSQLGRMSQLFNFFVFLGLRIFTRIYCIWSRTREQNFNDVLSYNWPPFLIMSRLTYPNDLPMTSNSLFFSCLFYVPSFLIWVVLVWSKTGEPNASFQERGNPFPTKPQKAEFEVTSFLIRFLGLWSRKGEPYTNDLHQPWFEVTFFLIWVLLHWSRRRYTLFLKTKFPLGRTSQKFKPNPNEIFLRRNIF